jgi:hypothetical protein
MQVANNRQGERCGREKVVLRSGLNGQQEVGKVVVQVVQPEEIVPKQQGCRTSTTVSEVLKHEHKRKLTWGSWDSHVDNMQARTVGWYIWHVQRRVMASDQSVLRLRSTRLGHIMGSTNPTAGANG